VLPWVFIHGTDKVEKGLMVLFFGLVFSIGSPGSFSTDAVDCDVTSSYRKYPIFINLCVMHFKAKSG